MYTLHVICYISTKIIIVTIINIFTTSLLKVRSSEFFISEKSVLDILYVSILNTRTTIASVLVLVAICLWILGFSTRSDIEYLLHDELLYDNT